MHTLPNEQTHQQKPHAPLHPVDPRSSPFQNISLDLIAPLPKSSSYNAILVIVDKSTKKAVFVPTNTTLTSKGFAKLLVHHWIKHFGLPQTITSDRGPQFIAEFTQAFYDSCRIKGTPSTAFHPQTNRQTEHVNQELEIYLRFFVNSLQNNWHELLPLAEFSYNDHAHSTTCISPHYTTLGFYPWKGDLQVIPKPRNPTIIFSRFFPLFLLLSHDNDYTITQCRSTSSTHASLKHEPVPTRQPGSSSSCLSSQSSSASPSSSSMLLHEF